MTDSEISTAGENEAELVRTIKVMSEGRPHSLEASLSLLKASYSSDSKSNNRTIETLSTDLAIDAGKHILLIATNSETGNAQVVQDSWSFLKSVDWTPSKSDSLAVASFYVAMGMQKKLEEFIRKEKDITPFDAHDFCILWRTSLLGAHGISLGCMIILLQEFLSSASNITTNTHAYKEFINLAMGDLVTAVLTDQAWALFESVKKTDLAMPQPPSGIGRPSARICTLYPHIAQSLLVLFISIGSISRVSSVLSYFIDYQLPLESQDAIMNLFLTMLKTNDISLIEMVRFCAVFLIQIYLFI
jgi:hypothetical protein